MTEPTEQQVDDVATPADFSKYGAQDHAELLLAHARDRLAKIARRTKIDIYTMPAEDGEATGVERLFARVAPDTDALLAVTDQAQRDLEAICGIKPVEAPATLTGVKSSNIDGFDYDEDSRRFFVQFKGAAVYVYFGVPPDVAEGFAGAPSHGKYLNIMVKGEYPFVKVTA